MSKVLKVSKVILDTRDSKKLGNSGNNETCHVRWDISRQIKDIPRGNISWIQYNKVTMCNSFVNIIPSGATFKWDVFIADAFSDTYSVIIPTGQYTAAQLIPVLAAAMSAAVGTISATAATPYTVVMDAITNLITITNSTGNKIQMYANSTSTINRILGFTGDHIPAIAMTANRIPDLRGLSSIQLKSNFAGSNDIRYSGSGESNYNSFSIDIPMAQAAFGETLVWQNLNPHDLNYVNNIPHYIECELRTRSSRITHNSSYDWSMEVLVAHYQ